MLSLENVAVFAVLFDKEAEWTQNQMEKNEMQCDRKDIVRKNLKLADN